MSIDDTPPPRPVPRNVPTLTEIVTVAGEPAAPLPPAVPAMPAAPVAAPTAQQLLALLGADFDQLIADAIARALHEQMQGLQARVQRTVAEVVRDALAREAHRRAVGENP